MTERVHINLDSLLEIRCGKTAIRLRSIDLLCRVRRPRPRVFADPVIGQMSRAAIYSGIRNVFPGRVQSAGKKYGFLPV